MDKSEVMDAIFIWVLGMCFEYNQRMQLFSEFKTYHNKEYPGFDNPCALWVQDCQTKVWRYVSNQQKTLDASYSDFQCIISSKADRIFKVHLN